MSVRLLGLLVLLCMPACRRDVPDEAAKDQAPLTSTPAPAITPSQLDRLRSLGYLDYARDPADESDSGTVVFDEARAYPGYNLYTIRSLRRTELMDLMGRRATIIRLYRYEPEFLEGIIARATSKSPEPD